MHIVLDGLAGDFPGWKTSVTGRYQSRHRRRQWPYLGAAVVPVLAHLAYQHARSAAVLRDKCLDVLADGLPVLVLLESRTVYTRHGLCLGIEASEFRSMASKSPRLWRAGASPSMASSSRLPLPLTALW